MQKKTIIFSTAALHQSCGTSPEYNLSVCDSVDDLDSYVIHLEMNHQQTTVS